MDKYEMISTSKLVLTTWLTTDGLLFNSIGFTSESLSLLESKDIESKIISDGDFGIKPISAYLGKYFSQPVNKQDAFLYKGTNALSKILFGDNRMAGILYPTVKDNGNEDNFVIKKHIIDNRLLELDRVEFVEIMGIENGRHKYKILDIGNLLPNGNIKWSESKCSWTLYDDSDEIYFHEENNEYKAYSLKGEPIDSDLE